LVGACAGMCTTSLLRPLVSAVRHCLLILVAWPLLLWLSLAWLLVWLLWVSLLTAVILPVLLTLVLFGLVPGALLVLSLNWLFVLGGK
jgi:hypothetical protein